MSTIVIPPPRAVKLSWKLLTAPVDVSVVEVANSAEAGTPKRVSLPSIAAPTALGTVPWWAISAAVVANTAPAQMTTIAARIAYP